MKYDKSSTEAAKGDMTPMIDMTFQLIAFFMVLINFTEAEQDDRIKLPNSELAKPPDAPFESPITLQLTEDDNVLFSGEIVPISGITVLLNREKSVLQRQGKSPSGATIIIRADSQAKTGAVQQLIQHCQETGFEKFALRAVQQERDG